MSFTSILRRVSEYTDYEVPHHINKPNILVVGVGGAGCNAINRMKRLGLEVPTIAINTDYPHLRMIESDTKVLLKTPTGMGTGGNEDIGEQSAILARDRIGELLQGAEIVFLTAGLGGGTGTGALPVIADIAREQGAIVISIVTIPFKIEKGRVEKARKGLKNVIKSSNTVIVLENEKLMEIVPNRPINEAFLVMDQLISYAIMSFVDIITKPSLINIDLSDVKYIMGRGRLSTLLISEGKTNDIRKVITDALNNPLLNVDYSTANGALIHITVGEDATLSMIHSTMDTLSSFLKDNSRISMGARVDPEYNERIRILVVLTGIKVPFVEEQKVESLEDLYEIR